MAYKSAKTARRWNGKYQTPGDERAKKIWFPRLAFSVGVFFPFPKDHLNYSHLTHWASPLCFAHGNLCAMEISARGFAPLPNL